MNIWRFHGNTDLQYGFKHSQNYVSVNKTITRNIQYFILFRLNDNTTINNIVRNHNIDDIDKDIFKRAYQHATKEKLNFFMIDLKGPKEKRPSRRHRFVPLFYQHSPCQRSPGPPSLTFTTNSWYTPSHHIPTCPQTHKWLSTARHAAKQRDQHNAPIFLSIHKPFHWSIHFHSKNHPSLLITSTSLIYFSYLSFLFNQWMILGGY